MAIKNWDTKTSRILYRRFEAGESLIEGASNPWLFQKASVKPP